MDNLITAQLQILYQASIENRRHVNSLEIKRAPTPEEQLMQDSMYNILQKIPEFILYLIECCSGTALEVAKTRLAQEFISRIEYDLKYAKAHIMSAGVTDIDKILTIDTQIVYSFVKDTYQELNDIKEVEPIIELLRNFPTTGGER